MRVSSGRASPNQTTPGRRKPILHSGHLGSSSGLIVWVLTFGSRYAARALIVLAEAARRSSSAASIWRMGWNGSS